MQEENSAMYYVFIGIYPLLSSVKMNFWINIFDLFEFPYKNYKKFHWISFLSNYLDLDPRFSKWNMICWEIYCLILHTFFVSDVSFKSDIASNYLIIFHKLIKLDQNFIVKLCVCLLLWIFKKLRSCLQEYCCACAKNLHQ